MNQDRVLKIIKGLNTFSPDDIEIMTGFEESEVLKIIEQLAKNKIIIKTSDNEYNFVNKIPERKRTFQLIEKPVLKIIKDNNITFKIAAEYFLSNYAIQNCTISTFKTYKSLLKTHLVPFFGNMKLKEITQSNIKEFIDLKSNEGLTNKRLNSNVTLFGNMFNKFKEWEFISDSPYNGIINVKYNKETEIKVLNETEIQMLLNKAKNNYPKLSPMILLILSTGLKRGEMLALKKEDIDLKNAKININKTIFEGEIIIPKVKTIIRQVNISENIMREIKKIIKDKKEEDFIFYDKGLSWFTQDKYIRISLSNLLKQLNLPRITFNELRHTYAYDAIQKGMSIDSLHKQLGDYSIQATMDRYRDFIR
ncbi:MAG TPA: tyrosine-type recombinase/integrase [Candidatus Gastranaerophilales bacterium]|nr:tyrosine-type recombinase/integrase [Candidatus Gastranaerophilales bacterium]